MIVGIKKTAQARMQKSVEALKHELSKVRTGRAHPSLLDHLMVPYYGAEVPLSQVASVSASDARTLTITPWEKSMVQPIEKAIQASELGLNPQSDGNMLRLPIPPLSEERRKELFKNCKKTGEESKVAIRNVRRDANEKLKEAEKDKDVTQDEAKKGLDEIQKLTDKFIKTVDDILVGKEKEIMEV